MSEQFVSMSYACSREVRELGEDAKTLTQVDLLYANLLAGVMLARHAVRSQRAKDALAEMELALSEVRHDASFSTLVSDAADAAAMAKVRPIRMPATAELRIATKDGVRS